MTSARLIGKEKEKKLRTNFSVIIDLETQSEAKEVLIELDEMIRFAQEKHCADRSWAIDLVKIIKNE